VYVRQWYFFKHLKHTQGMSICALCVASVVRRDVNEERGFTRRQRVFRVVVYITGGVEGHGLGRNFRIRDERACV
jgi:hypothetical protein